MLEERESKALMKSLKESSRRLRKGNKSLSEALRNEEGSGLVKLNKTRALAGHYFFSGAQMR